MIAIAGIKGTSLIDYPGRIAAVLYTSRCNFRCPFCHNRRLALGEEPGAVTPEEALDRLAARRGFIDGVVVTGGEPTLHGGLGDLLAAVRSLGLAVKLDTNGSDPAALRGLLDAGLLDSVAMDIKTSWPKYRRAAGVPADTGRLAESVALIKASGVDGEFRTTCVPYLVEAADIEAIGWVVGGDGRLALQQFQPENTLDPDYGRLVPYAREVLEEFLEIARRHVASCRLVGAG